MASTTRVGPGSTSTPTRTGQGGNDSRLLLRRKGLPGGRALVGGFLVAGAAVSVFAAYLEVTSGPEQSWVLASRDIVAGQEVRPGDVTVADFDVPPELGARAFVDDSPVVGTIAVAPLSAGDIVLATHIAESQVRGHEEMSLAVEPARAVGGSLKAGDRIDVLATFGGVERAVTVASDILLIEVDHGDGGLTGSTGLVLTIALEPGDDALAITGALNNGQLQLLRTTSRGAGSNGR